MPLQRLPFILCACFSSTLFVQVFFCSLAKWVVSTHWCCCISYVCGPLYNQRLHSTNFDEWKNMSEEREREKERARAEQSRAKQSSHEKWKSGFEMACKMVFRYYIGYGTPYHCHSVCLFTLTLNITFQMQHCIVANAKMMKDIHTKPAGKVIERKRETKPVPLLYWLHNFTSEWKLETSTEWNKTNRNSKFNLLLLSIFLSCSNVNVFVCVFSLCSFFLSRHFSFGWQRSKRWYFPHT